MALDNSQSQEADLDRTDRLPILAGFTFDEDVEDDAVPMDQTGVMPGIRPDFSRPSGLDLPSLAESVRSVEERISRQAAEFEALSRSYEKAREAEATALVRAQELAAELAAARRSLEAEQSRTREFERAVAEKAAAAESARARVEETLRDVERHQVEARTLRDTLAVRDAAIVNVTHSLGERDAQLNALQREHAKVVPALEARSKAGVELEAELKAVRARAESLASELGDTRQTVASLSAKLKVGDGTLASTRREFGALKTQAASYLEMLRTREWRRGFDHNLFRGLDAKIGKYQDDRGVLQADRDRLREHLTAVEARLADRETVIAELKAAAEAEEIVRDQQSTKLQRAESAGAGLEGTVAALETERGRLQAELAARDAALAKLQSAVVAAEALRDQQIAKLQQVGCAAAELEETITSLRTERGELQAELAARDASLAQLQSAVVAGDAARVELDRDLQSAKSTRDDLTGQIVILEREQNRLNAELLKRDAAVAEARVSVTSEVLRVQNLLAAAQTAHTSANQQIERLQSEAHARNDEMAVLMAHLQEARRPTQAIEAEVKRLSDELSVRGHSLEQLNEENRSLRAALERARGALEEREFLIRRLERSESNNANVLGRIQTSIERLGAVGTPAGGAAGSAAAPVEVAAELIRVDGHHKTSYPLAKRTRIGRAPGCEMQIESSSVSRHHAMVLMGPREVVIEDLNSTNGVLVNGRKVSRQTLNDGDLVAIGDAQFKVSLKLAPRVLAAAATDLG